MSLLLHYLFCIEGVTGSINYFFFKKKRFCSLLWRVTAPDVSLGMTPATGFALCCTHGDFPGRLAGTGSAPSSPRTSPALMWLMSCILLRRCRLWCGFCPLDGGNGAAGLRASALCRWVRRLQGTLTLFDSCTARQARPGWRFKVTNGHSVLQL